MTNIATKGRPFQGFHIRTEIYSDDYLAFCEEEPDLKASAGTRYRAAKKVERLIAQKRSDNEEAPE